MMAEADSNFDTDILSSFESSDDDGNGVANLPADSSVRTKMSGVLNLCKGVEKLGSDKYASRDEEENPHGGAKKSRRNHLFSRKKKKEGHDDHFSVAKREKYKRLSKFRKKRAAAKPLRVSSAAAAAPVRLADILGGVGDVAYSTGNTGSWRAKIERKNTKTDLAVTNLLAEYDNDKKISVLSKQSKQTLSTDRILNNHADTSGDYEKHKGYTIDKGYDTRTEDDAIRDESETMHLYENQAIIPFDDSRRDYSNVEERQTNSNAVMKLDKYIVPSPSTLEQPSLAGTTIRMLLKSSIVAARAQKWNDVLRLISSHPEILLTRSQDEDNQTLLHVIAGGVPVPRKVVTKIVNTRPEAVSYTDNDGCLPLHHACSVMKQIAMVEILMDSWPEGATIPNIDGDIPLHVAAWGGVGYENICNVLIDAHAIGASVPNSSGGLPMHMACCKENASSVIVKRLMEVHKRLDIDITRLDRNGNSPLHVAIKTKASHEVVSELFYGWDTTEAFLQQDGDGMYPLHMALIVHKASPEVIEIISKAAPSTMSIPLKDGLMPARVAIERLMPGNIVQDLVLADMPVQLGNIKNDSISEVVFRQHNHSWWFLGIRQDKYKDVIDNIFANLASMPEIIALAQVTDPNGTSSLYDGAHHAVRGIIKKYLRFCERYELVTLKKAKIIDGVLILRAVDHGNETTLDKHNTIGSNPLSANGYTTVDSDSTNDNCFEVILYDSPVRDVMLHCCPKDSTPHDEIAEEVNMRKGADLSSSECQLLYNAHVVDGGKIGCNGDIICLALERPVMTLDDIFESSRFRKRKSKEWARKSCNLLKRVAYVLSHLHERGFVHGHVGPSTIAKFDGENNWKLTDIGKISRIGSSMRGVLRTGVPPESVSKCAIQEPSTIDLRKIVSFENDAAEAPERISEVNKTKPSDDDTTNKIPANTLLKFTPARCTAAVSWDIWSLGLVMGQLILGQSMVYLPNFENATDAHLKNLYNFNETNLQKIGQAARKSAGENASQLLVRLLHPSPEKRPLSIADILMDNYFIDESEPC